LKISEKAALAMAGYTKAEIEAMEAPNPAPAPSVQNPAPAVQNPAPAVQNPVIQQAPEWFRKGPESTQTGGQYDGLETLLQQILQGQQASTQAMQAMTQTMQANAVGMGVQQQPAATADTITARIIDPTYGKDVK
jgi:hypothetical protein